MGVAIERQQHRLAVVVFLEVEPQTPLPGRIGAADDVAFDFQNLRGK